MPVMPANFGPGGGHWPSPTPSRFHTRPDHENRTSPPPPLQPPSPLLLSGEGGCTHGPCHPCSLLKVGQRQPRGGAESPTLRMPVCVIVN